MTTDTTEPAAVEKMLEFLRSLSAEDAHDLWCWLDSDYASTEQMIEAIASRADVKAYDLREW